MRWLINYIRSLFCNHDYELLDETDVHTNAYCIDGITRKVKIGRRWTYRCRKCGYSYTYKNYKK